MNNKFTDFTAFILNNYKKYKFINAEVIYNNPNGEIQILLSTRTMKHFIAIIDFDKYIEIDGCVREINNDTLSTYLSDSLEDDKFSPWSITLNYDELDFDDTMYEIVNQMDSTAVTEICKSLIKLLSLLDNYRDKYEMHNIDQLLKELLISYSAEL